MESNEIQMILASRIEACRRKSTGFRPDRLRDAEYRVFSQFGDDGIIELLTGWLPADLDTFIEFGVENYRESNTRLLLFRDNWRGLVIDGAKENARFIRAEPWFWRYDLTVDAEFLTADNIDSVFRRNGFGGEIGLLSVDVDGNDYWIWEAIESVSPAIVVCEYNALFAPGSRVSVPYDPKFHRTRAHYSNLYAGCSLGALESLARRKGYILAGTNSAGNNAYFLRNDLEWPVPASTAADSFTRSKFREARGKSGELLYETAYAVAGDLIGHLSVIDVETGAMLHVRDVMAGPEGDLK